MTAAPSITAFFHEPTNAVSYLVADPGSNFAAIIDPVLDFDPASGEIGTESADALLKAADEQGATIAWLLETHPHADHLSAAAYLKARTGAKVGIGAGIAEVQARLCPAVHAADVQPGGGDFDGLFRDGDMIALGSLSIEVMATPGHTPACVSYKLADALFVGDTMFMPDYGTARTDFPGGCARTLYRSIQRILSLPRETRLFLCHDYKAPGRDRFAWETTVGEQLDCNVHLRGGVGEDDYVAMREARDATLCMPKLFYPSVQVNIRGGRLPPAEADGTRSLRIPLTLPVGAPGLSA